MLDAKSRKTVLVVGSFSEQESRRRRDHFAEICRRIGRRLAEQGHALLIASTRPITADRNVLDGYLAGGGHEPIFVRREDPAQDLEWQKLVARAPDARAQSLPRTMSTLAWRLRTLRSADAVVLLGGHEGTRQVLDICWIRGMCHVGVPIFGGAAQEAFQRLDRQLLDLGDKKLAAVHHDYAEDERVIDLIDPLSGRWGALYPPVVRKADAEQHVFETLKQAASRSPRGNVSANGLLAAALSASPAQGAAFAQFQAIVADLVPNLAPDGESAKASSSTPFKPGPTTSSDTVHLEGELMTTLRIAWSAVPDRTVAWGRVLVTALVCDRTLAQHDTFGPWQPEIFDRWQRFLRGSKDEANNQDAWDEVLGELRERLDGPTEDEIEEANVAAAMAGFNADAVRAAVTADDDHLGFTPEVEAMAAVLAAREVKPPLSVALLGDWGVGKTQFMRQLQTRIHTLAVRSREVDDEHRLNPDDPEAREPAFWSDIAQIEFNAWHFMDTNLWASLVTRIFGGLTAHVRERNPQKPEHAVLDELASLSAEFKKLQLSHETLTGDVEKLRTEIESTHEQVRQVSSDLEGAQPHVQFGRALVGLLRSNPTAKETLRAAGVTVAFDDHTALAKSIEQLRESGATTHAKFLLLLQGKRPIWIAASLAAALIAGPLLAYLVAKGNVSELAEEAARIVGWAAGLVAATHGWLGKVQQQLDAVADLAKKARASATQPEEARAQQLTQRLHELEATRAAKERERDEKLAEVDRVTAEIQSIRSGRRLLEFLQERAKSKDYAGQLGIISTIRADFERLSDELSQQSGARREAWKEGATAPETNVTPIRSIDRIILYIDDLDRCPPERVVEVMQAVHLLLAFPLFVVVVAVDSRWMMRSLEKIYPDFLYLDDEITSPREDDSSDVSDSPRIRRRPHATTPHNYLEKIFQISFSVRPIEREGYLGLLRHFGGPQDLGLPRNANTERTTSAEHDEPPAATAGTEKQYDEHASQDSADETRTPPPMRIELNPPTLELSDAEWRFMARLHPLFSTPRAVKRFVNTYRIIKVTYADDLGDLAAQQRVQALLALLVAHPQKAASVFRLIHDSDDSRELSALAGELAASDSQALLENLAAMEELKAATSELLRPWVTKVSRFATSPIAFAPRPSQRAADVSAATTHRAYAASR